MRIYISGQMTGKPDLNRTAFDAAEKRLREAGHFVINPHALSAQFGTPKELSDAFAAAYANPLANAGGYEVHSRRLRLARAVMDADLAAVRSCDAIYLLRGWNESRGAKKELDEALKHGLKVIMSDDWEHEQEQRSLKAKIELGRKIKELQEGEEK